MGAATPFTAAARERANVSVIDLLRAAGRASESPLAARAPPDGRRWADGGLVNLLCEDIHVPATAVTLRTRPLTLHPAGGRRAAAPTASTAKQRHQTLEEKAAGSAVKGSVSFPPTASTAKQRHQTLEEKAAGSAVKGSVSRSSPGQAAVSDNM